MIGLCAFVYLYVVPYYPDINNPNENVRFYMTAALVEQQTYRIDALRERWGWVNDAAVRDGHCYSVKAPGASLLGVPAYFVAYSIAGEDLDRTTALWAVRVTASILPVLVFLWFFYRWLSERSRFGFSRETVFFSVALGSPLLGYSYLFASHATSAAAAFGAFMCLYRARRTGIGAFGSAFAGLLTASVTWLEYPGILISVPLTVYAFFALDRRRYVPFVLGALGPTLSMMHFQWSAFGNPFTPGHLMVENATFRAGHEKGFYGAETFHWEGARALLFDFRLGMLALTPIFFFAIVGFIRLILDRARRLDAAVAIISMTGLFVAICFMNNWHAGWSIGPRYLTALIPFVAWGALEGLDAAARLCRTGAAALAFGAMTAAFVACGTASVYYPHLPSKLTHPLRQLFAVLIAHDYAPLNGANLWGVYGTKSMVPVFLAAVIAVVWPMKRMFRGVRLASVAAGSVFVCLLLLWPHWSAERTVFSDRALSFVTRHWYPKGHDRISRWESEKSGEPWSAADYRKLAELYLAEGRSREARVALRKARSAK